MPPGVAPRYTATLGDTINVWSGVNPTTGPARADARRRSLSPRRRRHLTLVLKKRERFVRDPPNQ
jgi:hypothetical protein